MLPDPFVLPLDRSCRARDAVTPVEQAKVQILRVMFAAEHTDHALLVVLQELSRHARERDIIVRLCHLAPPLTCRSHSPKQSLP